jgi:phosphomannomutase
VDLELKPGQNQKAIEYFKGAKMTRLLDWPVAKKEDLDGVKAYLGDVGWVMVRASGTEPMLRVYSETTNPETTKRVLDATCALVKKL